jgi:hypothetical protein
VKLIIWSLAATWILASAARAQSFGPVAGPLLVPIGFQAPDLAIAQVIGAEAPDVLAPDIAQSRLLILENLGLDEMPAFHYVATAIGPSALATGDVDADGDIDVVTRNASSLSFLWNLGGGAFARADVASSGSGPITLGDFDGDGDLDALCGAHRYMTAGTSVTGPIAITTAPSVVDPIAFDFDGDGLADIAGHAPSIGLTQVEVHVNDGAGGFVHAGGLSVGPLGFPNAVAHIAGGDLDQDGRDDLVLTGADNFEPIVLQTVPGQASGFSTATGDRSFSYYAAFSVTAPAELADFDGDGDLDYFWWHQGFVDNGFLLPFVSALHVHAFDGFTPLLFTGFDPFGGVATIHNGGSVFAAGDLDGSGTADIVTGTPGAATTLSVYVNTSPGAAPARTLTLASGGSPFGQLVFPLEDPIVVEVRDAVTNAPVVRAPVAFRASTSGIDFGAPLVLTDAQGRASVRPQGIANPSFAPGAVAWTVSSPGAAPISGSTFIRGLTASYHANGLFGISYRHENAGVPMVVALDLVQPFPYFTATPFGDVYTSILAPQPGLAIVDGIGLFGPPAPGFVTQLPITHRTLVLPVFMPSVLRVLQVYLIDPSYPLPDSIIVSNPFPILL